MEIDPSLKAWLDALTAATDELATTTLGFEGCQVDELLPQIPYPPPTAGAYLAMVGNEQTLQLAIVSDMQGCRLLSGALLGMVGDEDGLGESDIADAMGEIINIVAGGVKTRMAGSDKGFKLGLPMFIDGHVEPVKETEQAAHRVTLGSIRAYLLTLRQKRTV